MKCLPRSCRPHEALDRTSGEPTAISCTACTSLIASLIVKMKVYTTFMIYFYTDSLMLSLREEGLVAELHLPEETSWEMTVTMISIIKQKASDWTS